MIARRVVDGQVSGPGATGFAIDGVIFNHAIALFVAENHGSVSIFHGIGSLVSIFAVIPYEIDGASLTGVDGDSLVITFIYGYSG